MTLRRSGIESRRFDVTSCLHINGSKYPFWIFRPLKMRTTRCLERSGSDYSVTLRNIPEEENSQRQRSENHKIRTTLVVRAKNFGVKITD